MIVPPSPFSKCLVIGLVIVITYFLFMDVAMYIRLQQTFSISLTSSISNGTNSMDASQFNSMPNASSEQLWPNTCDVSPLCHPTVKALLLDHVNLYVFAPLITLLDRAARISESWPWLTPNMISSLHVGVACIAAKLAIADTLTYRRWGVILFEVRTLLDDLDGHVAHARKHRTGEYSEVGTTGYYVDGICDTIGCLVFLVAIFIHLRRNPPRRLRGYMHLPLVRSHAEAVPLTQMCKEGDGAGDATAYQVVSDNALMQKYGKFSSSITTNYYYQQLWSSSRRKIAKVVGCFGCLLMVNAIAWNRYLAIYQDLLETDRIREVAADGVRHGALYHYTAESLALVKRQQIVFTSLSFYGVTWLWRFVNVHSLMHLLMLAIFCDRMWSFLKNIQYIGFGILLTVVCITKVHITDAHNFIYRHNLNTF